MQVDIEYYEIVDWKTDLPFLYKTLKPVVSSMKLSLKISNHVICYHENFDNIEWIVISSDSIESITVGIQTTDRDETI